GLAPSTPTFLATSRSPAPRLTAQTTPYQTFPAFPSNLLSKVGITHSCEALVAFAIYSCDTAAFTVLGRSGSLNMSTGSGLTGNASILMPQLSPETHLKTHSVQFYEQDSFLLDSLTKLIGKTLVPGDVALGIATAEH